MKKQAFVMAALGVTGAALSFPANAASTDMSYCTQDVPTLIQKEQFFLMKTDADLLSGRATASQVTAARQQSQDNLHGLQTQGESYRQKICAQAKH